MNERKREKEKGELEYGGGMVKGEEECFYFLHGMKTIIIIGDSLTNHFLSL